MLSKFLLASLATMALASNSSNATAASGNATAAPSGNATAAPSGNATAAPATTVAPAGNATAAPTTVAATTAATAAPTTVASTGTTATTVASSTSTGNTTTDTHDGHKDDNKTAAAGNVTTGVMAASTKNMARPVEVKTTLAASVTSDCKQSTQFMNIVLMASMASYVGMVDGAGGDFAAASKNLCGSDGSVPTGQPGCMNRDAPASSGFTGGAGTFGLDNKMFSTASCARRQLAANGTAAGGEVTVTDTPVLKISTTVASSGTGATTMAALETKAGTGLAAAGAEVAAFTKKISEVIAGTCASDCDLAKMLGGMPKTAGTGGAAATAMTVSDLAGKTVADVTALSTEMATAATATSTATITASASAPVVTDETPSSTTSSAASVFVSAAAFVGAFLMM